MVLEAVYDRLPDITPVEVAESNVPSQMAEDRLLSAHLEAHYHFDITSITRLDKDVYRVDKDSEPSWVTRIFQSSRDIFDVQVEARLLKFLEQNDFPAERCANREPVTLLHGQPILVTEFIAGQRPQGGTAAFTRLGKLLGKLHTLPAPDFDLPRGGAWHHIACGGEPAEEVRAARGMLETFALTAIASQRQHVATLIKALDDLGSMEHLPEALTHPDFVLANAVVPPGGGFRMVDWTGVGYGPRVFSLGWALWTAGHRDRAHLDAVWNAYRKFVTLEHQEVETLPSAILFRPLVLCTWEVCNTKRDVALVASGMDHMRARAEEFAGYIRETVGIKPPT